MSSFPALCEQLEVLEDVVLSMEANPAPVEFCQHDCEQLLPLRKDDLPDLVVYRLHHSVFGLLYGNLEALGLAIAGHGGRGMAHSTVGIHFEDTLVWLEVYFAHLSKSRRSVPTGRSSGGSGRGQCLWAVFACLLLKERVVI